MVEEGVCEAADDGPAAGQKGTGTRKPVGVRLLPQDARLAQPAAQANLTSILPGPDGQHTTARCQGGARLPGGAGHASATVLASTPDRSCVHAHRGHGMLSCRVQLLSNPFPQNNSNPQPTDRTINRPYRQKPL